MSRISSIDVRVPLSFECNVYGVHIKPATIAHWEAETDCFTTKAFAEEKRARFYYDVSIEETMPELLNARDVYGERMMAITRE